MKRAHFESVGKRAASVTLHNVPLARPISGRREATVIVTQSESGDGLVIVRPLRDREYTLPLSAVAEIVCWKVAKEEASR